MNREATHGNRRVFGSVACVVAAFVSACDVLGPGAGEPASVEVEVSSRNLMPGDVAQLRATVRDSRGRTLKDADSYLFSSDRHVASVTQTGNVSAHAAGLVRLGAQVSGVIGYVDVAVGPLNFNNVLQHAIEEFRVVWGLEVTAPAVTVDTIEINTNVPKSPTRFFSTVFGDENRYLLELWPDGTIRSFSHAPHMRPVGHYRVAVVVVNHGYTNLPDLLATEWVAATDSINREHAEWAQQNGLPAPLLTFEPITLLASPGDLVPEDPESLWEYLASRRIDYDVPVVVNHDPHGLQGAYYRPRGERFQIYIGCMPVTCSGYVPGTVRQIATAELHDMARTLFHHEIGHAFGWGHAWGGGPYGTRLITDPALFGWTDTDGDGVIEILDSTPYGASGRFK